MTVAGGVRDGLRRAALARGHSLHRGLEEEFDTVVFAHSLVLRSGVKVALRNAVDHAEY